MNEKWWSVLFGVVMAACGGLFVVAPIVGWWMPEAASSHAWDIDFLFYLILGITGFFFVLTEGLLVAFMYLYGTDTPIITRKATVFWAMCKPLTNYFNSAKRIEIGWTIVPAVILLYLAFAQIDTWQVVKYKSRMPAFATKDGKPLKEIPLQVDISARQFEWRIRYPSPATWEAWKKNPKLADAWVKTPNFDDLYVPNDLHVIYKRHVVVQLSTKDVIHSFNIPQMRVKQDALPGKTIPVWFMPTQSNVTKIPDKNDKDKVMGWEDGGGRDPETGKPENPSLVWQIPCAELCGWGHSRMIGRLYVHDSEEDFLAWLHTAAVKEHYFGAAPQKSVP